MGEGLKRVAKLCGGLTVRARGETAHYNAEGKLVSKTVDREALKLAVEWAARKFYHRTRKVAAGTSTIDETPHDTRVGWHEICAYFPALRENPVDYRTSFQPAFEEALKRYHLLPVLKGKMTASDWAEKYEELFDVVVFNLETREIASFPGKDLKRDTGFHNAEKREDSVLGKIDLDHYSTEIVPAGQYDVGAKLAEQPE